LPELHGDRSRAESFGARADVYDRLRPSPPDAVIDDLVALAPAHVLDVGCGTGKAARPLRSRGLDVLGVEPDERMAAIARGHGVPVEVAAFEDWDARGRRFELIVACDSWHWVDPERGWRKVGEVIAPGGSMVRIFNQHEPSPEIEAIFRRFWGDILAPGRPAADDPRVEHRSYEWETTYSADEYLALVGTYSATQALEPGPRAEFERTLRAALPGTVTARYRTVVSRSRAMPR